MTLIGFVFAADYPKTTGEDMFYVYSNLGGPEIDVFENQNFYLGEWRFATQNIVPPLGDSDIQYVYTALNGTEAEPFPVPTYGAKTANTTTAGAPVRINCTITCEGDEVVGYIPSWNNSGIWTNGTYVAVGVESVNATLAGTWNSGDHAVISVKFYAVNSVGTWTGSSITSFTVHAIAASPTATPVPEPTPEPPIVGTIAYLDYYFHAGTATTNNVTGYWVSTDTPTQSNTVAVNTAGTTNVSWGFRVYLVNDGADRTELTSGVAGIMTRTEDGEGLLSATWTPPATTFIFGESAIEFVLYSRFNSEAWTTQAVFITDALFYKGLVAEQTTFYLYFDRVVSGGDTSSTATWGTVSYISGIDGLAFRTGGATDWQKYQLGNGNLLGFLIAPYTVQIGNGFYALVLFGLFMSLYIRYRTIAIPLLLIVLLGGTGGVINLLVGDLFIGFVWLVAAFGLALIYWRVFR